MVHLALGPERFWKIIVIAIFFYQYCDCDLICDFFFFFKALYILYYSTKTSNKSLYSMQCWARYFKKVISYITSYFSHIVAELHHYKIN